LLDLDLRTCTEDLSNKAYNLRLLPQEPGTIAKVYVFILAFEGLELLADCVSNFARKEEVGQETYLGDALIS